MLPYATRYAARLFGGLCSQPDDNPTIGIILCAEKDRTVAKYSALADKKGIFASRYLFCLPTEDELAQALEPTSALFLTDTATAPKKGGTAEGPSL